MRTLLIGGARSGKSRLAEQWARQRAEQVWVLAPAQPSDVEMSARIAAHQRERPTHWRLREEPVHLGAALRELDRQRGGELILVDCLTVWIANCLWPQPLLISPGEVAPDTDRWIREQADFLTALAHCQAELILVTNEVGCGIVPAVAAARIFQDEQGRLNQLVAAQCEEVHLVVAGLPLPLKQESMRSQR